MTPLWGSTDRSRGQALGLSLEAVAYFTLLRVLGNIALRGNEVLDTELLQL